MRKYNLITATIICAAIGSLAGMVSFYHEPCASLAETYGADKTIDEIKIFIKPTETYKYQFTAEEKEILAKIAQAEAGSGEVKDKALIMQIVLNRVNSLEFPNSIHDVVFESGQFTPISDGSYDAAVPDLDCYAALEAVQKGDFNWCDALFFASTPDCWAGRHRELAFYEWKHWFWY